MNANSGYVIVERYGPGWERYRAAGDASSPALYPDLQTVKKNFEQLQARSRDFVAVNPRDHEAPRRWVLAVTGSVSQLKRKNLYVHNTDPVRPLNRDERSLLESPANS